MKKTDIVKHDNRLTESIFNYEEIELNIFFGIIYELQENSDRVVLDAAKIKKYSMAKERSYKTFEDTIKKIQKKPIEIKTDKGKYKSVIPFPTLEFDTEDKTIIIKINEDIMPYFKEVKKQFTLYSLKEFLSLKKANTKRIFQLIKQYNSTGYRIIEIEELKKYLGVEGAYKAFTDFEKRILKPAKIEINKKTSIKVAYKKKKEGRSIKQIEFTFSSDQKEEFKTQGKIKEKNESVRVKKTNEILNEIEKQREQVTIKTKRLKKDIVSEYLENLGKSDVVSLKKFELIALNSILNLNGYKTFKSNKD